MPSSYLEMLTQPTAKPSRREELLQLAMKILALATMDDAQEGGIPRLDGTQPEIYVAPRYSPSP